MSTQNTAQPGKTISLPAASDISATPNRFVTVTAGQVALAGAGAAVDGVYDGTGGTAAGRPCKVVLDGMPLVDVGGSVTVGDRVKSDATGRAVTASAADVLNGLAKGKAHGTASTGAIPVIITPGPNQVFSTGVETLTGAGAASVYYSVTEWIATTDAATLADGLVVGQRKIVRAIVGTTGSSTLTPATVTANTDGGTTPAVFTFTDPGQEIELEWRSDGWKCVRAQSAGVETVVNAATANPLKATHNLAVDGTDDAIIPSGMFPGQQSRWRVLSAANTPVQTISGLFYLAAGTATGIDVDLGSGGTPAAGDHWTGEWDGARWATVSYLNAAIST